ncbi:MAG: NRDE family protein [Candidatus Cyclonatronum sp.]|uniref:NRDE family protein n=1 Tax=Cyclonatronum sp. TaxID=3024185 RepID=UPI0025BCD529|nr:NRDE family protein [Cyclonatronum sp.]MCH8486562.1 NRDE family protein [Cyclonatronum sp.]
MCTLSWQLNATRNELYLAFNRDEMLARVPGKPPGFFRKNGIRYMAPVDPQGGGTWIAANDRGVILCLLNDYMGKSSENYAGENKSRGLLVRRLITAGNGRPEDIRDFMVQTGEAPLPHNPFNLVVFSGVEDPVMWHWNGEKLEFTSKPPMPVVSAGLEQDKTQQLRAEVFGRLREQHGGIIPSEALLEAHQSAKPEPQPYSIAMQLPDKETVSITEVRLLQTKSEMQLEMAYRHGNPLSTPYQPLSRCSLTVPQQESRVQAREAITP